MTREVAQEGKNQSERNRIFLKVKEKIDAERQQKINEQKLVHENQQRLDVEKRQKDQADQVLKTKKEAEDKIEFVKNQEAEKRAQQMNVLLEELNQKRQLRSKQILNELEQRGIEKIGKNRIDYLLTKEENDVDSIESFYQKELDKDRLAFEVQQRRKRNDVEVHAHSTKCEEAKALLTYCNKFGDRDTEEIQNAINQRKEAELQTKQQLESATDPVSRYIKKQLEIRTQQHKDA